MDDRKKQALARAYERFLEEQAKKAPEDNFETEANAEAAVAEAVTEEPKEVIAAETEVPSTEKKDKKKESSLGKAMLLPVKGLGNGLAYLVDVHDRWQAKTDVVLIEMGKSLVTEYHNMLSRYRLSRKRIGSSVLYMTLISCAILLVFNHFTVYEYAYNGRVLGYVDDQTKVTDVLDVASTQLSKNNGVNIEFKGNDNITFSQVSSVDKTVDNSDTVVNKLAYMTDIEVDAYGIYEDGSLVSIVESEAVAQRTINAAKAIQSKTDEGMKLVSSKFLKPITVEPLTVMLTSVQTQSSAQIMATKGGTFNIYHIVDNDETIGSIAKRFTVENSQVCDPDSGKAIASINPGDKVLIKKDVEPIKVRIVEGGTMSEVVPYKKVIQKTKKLYKGDSTVKQQGKNGKQVITGKITKVNGKETKRDITKTEIITKVQNKIVLVGTAKRPKTAPTGVFGMPIRNYTLTSRVGARWGRIHQGLDLAAPVGTPIYASDGGTVIVSGWQAGYGNVIYIDHGNGRETRYGHCSQLLVPNGTKVYKGQEIALCGSTGNSTGPHLHFEIRYNGVYQDSGKILGLY